MGKGIASYYEQIIESPFLTLPFTILYITTESYELEKKKRSDLKKGDKSITTAFRLKTDLEKGLIMNFKHLFLIGINTKDL